jgi:hypothetical protein
MQTDTSGLLLDSLNAFQASPLTAKRVQKRTGPEALALGKPSEYIVDDKIGGTHTRSAAFVRKYPNATR